VLLVGDYPPPYGGVSVQVAALRHRLAALGDEVRVLDIGERRRHVRAGCLPARGPLRFAATVLRHARRGVLVHLHTNGHNTRSWIAALVCVGAGPAARRRTVVSLGSGRMPEFLDTASRAVRALARASLTRAGAVVVRNERAQAAVIALGAEPARVVVLPGFYGVTEAEIGGPPAAAVLFRRRHQPLLGAIASRGPEYGLALLIDAAARLRPRHPDLGVVLIGPDRMAESPPWTLALGERPRPALLATLRSLDVFVRPTYFDGDASSVREALALGIRVVASDTDFRPEGVWRFPRGDADLLAGTIETALAHSPRRVDSTSLPALLAVYDALPLDRQPATAPAAVSAGAARRLRVG
jgi:glycosyltransferase involved in cell wall biosynthesis